MNWPQDFVNKVICGDCLEVMKEMPDESIDMVWTDPPYGLNLNNGDLIHHWESAFGRDKRNEIARPIINDSREDMERVVRGAFKEFGRILKRECCCCCCCGGGGPIPLFADFSKWLDEPPLQFFQAVVWDKMGLGMGLRYRRNYEFILVAHRRNGKLLWNWNGRGMETANIVRIPKIIPQINQHPTEKPVALIKHFLKLHAGPDILVLDSFCGHGSTLIACVEMGLRFIGIEIDSDYCEIARKRIAQAREQQDLFRKPENAVAVQGELL